MDDELEPDVIVQEPPIPGQEPPKASGNLNLILGGILLLLIGMFLGYIGRGSFGPEARAAKSTATAQAAAVQTRAATNQQVMEMISQQITHWKGDAKAPITLIEFSDFQ
jgi:hypothetical protein